MNFFNRKSGHQTAQDAENAPSTNPYLDARREWVERYGDWVNMTKIITIVAVAAIAADVFLAYGLMTESGRTHTVTRIIRVNHLGQAQVVDPVTVSHVPGIAIRHSLEQWIVHTHEVISDPRAEKHIVDEATAMVTQSAQGPLNHWWKPRNPMRKLQNETVNVQVTSAVPLSPRTYQIQWTQKTYTLSGRLEKVSHWQGVIGYTIIPATTSYAIQHNPLGIYVTHFAWNRIL
jgi:type IV secretion system protein VirB5